MVRSGLMEKRLAEYLAHALQLTKLKRRFYQEGSMMLSEQASELCGVILGLNSIDFSFDLRSKSLDYKVPQLIDFTPYMTFEQSRIGIEHDRVELARLGMSAVSQKPALAPLQQPAPQQDEPLRDKSLQEELEEATTESHLMEGHVMESHYSVMSAKYKMVSEQKGYLEELLHLRETQLEECHRQREKLVETLQHYQIESKKERGQLESVVLELHSQMATMRVEHISQTQQMRLLMQRMPHVTVIDEPEIALLEIESAKLTSSVPSESPSPGSMANARQDSTLAPNSSDSRSLMSESSGVVSPHGEDSQSMVPMAGSLTSGNSFRSGETTQQDNMVQTTPAQQDNTVQTTQIESNISTGQSNVILNNVESDSSTFNTSVEVETAEEVSQDDHPYCDINEMPKDCDSV